MFIKFKDNQIVHACGFDTELNIKIITGNVQCKIEKHHSIGLACGDDSSYDYETHLYRIQNNNKTCESVRFININGEEDYIYNYYIDYKFNNEISFNYNDLLKNFVKYNIDGKNFKSFYDIIKYEVFDFYNPWFDNELISVMFFAHNLNKNKKYIDSISLQKKIDTVSNNLIDFIFYKFF